MKIPLNREQETEESAFLKAVDEGLASLDSGKFVSHEEVAAEVDRLLDLDAGPLV